MTADVFDAVASGTPFDPDDQALPDELAALSGCPQTPAFHAEGDVAVHTAMVVEQANMLLADHPALAALSGGWGATILRLAALLHDVGKPACTSPVPGRPGRVSSHGHADEGAYMVARLFSTVPPLARLPLAVRWAVHAAVRNHLWTYAADRVSAGAAIRSAHLLDPRLLAALWEADTRGRDCDDADELEHKVGYARLMLGDRGASVPDPWPHLDDLGIDPYADLTPRVRREFLRAVVHGRIGDAGAAHAFLAARERSGSGATLTWLFGLPGSGKSTWAAQHAARTGAEVLRVVGRRRRDRKANHARVREQVPALLRDGRDVVVDATHVTRESRDRWLAHAETYGADVHAVYLDVDLPEALARQRSRPSADAVPADVVRSMATVMRWPTPDEYGRLTVVSAGSDSEFGPTSRWRPRN